MARLIFAVQKMSKFSACVPKNLGGPRTPQEVVAARLKSGLRAAN